MPKKNKQSSGPVLGKSLMKDRFGGRKHAQSSNAESRHAYQQAEYSDPNLNLKSVTEMNSLDEFLAAADLLGTEFTAEKLNIHYVQPLSSGVISLKEQKLIEDAQVEHIDALKIPKRPNWNRNLTKKELENLEKESFLEWRRQLALVCEQEHITVTPFEKNLEFWRQLWRVIEKSDLVVQIVDARDPLLYRCKDLEDYVKFVGGNKKNMLLINKSDLLSQSQREQWLQYFNAEGLTVAFFSAIQENERLLKLEKENITSNDEIDSSSKCFNHAELLNKDQLLNFFSHQLQDKAENGDLITIGMVGYPNVGKSSTINTIMRSKKVSVSATPGRTKHFQTLFITPKMQLCDCPGLVFPSFVLSPAEMILSGILPIDEMRDHVPAVNLLCQRISREVLEATYGINIIKPREGEDPNRPPNEFEFLNAYGRMRGFMTSHGQPDHPRAARIVLKDYVNGKIIYSKSPPGFSKQEYEAMNPSVISQVLHLTKTIKENETLRLDPDTLIYGHQDNDLSMEAAIVKISRMNKKLELQEKNLVDNTFFRGDNIKAFTKGSQKSLGIEKPTQMKSSIRSSSKKHFNKKKEKVRRIRSNLE